MPNTAISALSAASALVGTEPLPIVQGGATVRSTPNAVVTLAAVTLAPKASPTFTGTPAAPTAAAATSTTQLATTAFVTTADDLKAPLASPTLSGVMTFGKVVVQNDVMVTGGCIFPIAGQNLAIGANTNVRVYLFQNNTERARLETDGTLVLDCPLVLNSYTVATLPASPVQGMTCFVTDATAPVWNVALVGTGAVVCKAFYNGAAWVAG